MSRVLGSHREGFDLSSRLILRSGRSDRSLFPARSSGSSLTHAAAVLMTIPVALMFFVFQKRIISGSLKGAVKE